jgi:leucyl aminopeptidase
MKGEAFLSPLPEIANLESGSLTEFNKKLVDMYLDIPWVDTKCGYACSDHASFSKAGYPSSFTIGKFMNDSTSYSF